MNPDPTISTPSSRSGRSRRPLRDEGVLIVGSGLVTAAGLPFLRELAGRRRPASRAGTGGRAS